MALLLKGNGGRSSGNPVYNSVGRTYGHYTRRSSVNYRNAANEGYKENFAVFRCMQERIKAVCNLKLEVVDYTGKEEKVLDSHKIAPIFDMASPNSTFSSLMQKAMISRILGGQAPFQYRPTIKAGALDTYRPDNVEYRTTGMPGAPYCDIYYDNGRRVPIPPEEFFIWMNYNPTDILEGMGFGMSMLQPLFKTIDQHNSIKDWNISLMEYGGVMSGIFSIPEVLDTPEFNRMQKVIKNTYSGKDNVGKFLLLDGGTEYHQISANPKEMDWVEGEKAMIVQICSGLEVDPILIGYNEYSSYNNKKEASKDLYTKTAIPELASFAEEFTLFLQRINMLSHKQKIRVVYSHIPELQQDLDKIADRLNKSDQYTVNEKRMELGKEEVTGGDVIIGDKYIINDGKTYVPMNFIDIDELSGKTSVPPPTNDEDFQS